MFSLSVKGKSKGEIKQSCFINQRQPETPIYWALAGRVRENKTMSTCGQFYSKAPEVLIIKNKCGSALASLPATRVGFSFR